MESVRSATVPDTVLPAHRRIFRILVAAGKEFGKDKGTRLSAALSFYTLFSLVPLLFLVVAVVGFVSGDSITVMTDCDDITVSAIPPDASNPVDRVLRQIDDLAGSEVSNQFAQLTCESSSYAGQALWIGIALAAWSGSSVFLHVQGVLNALFHAPDPERPGIINFIIQRGVGVVAALVLAVLFLTPLVAVAAINFLQDLIAISWLRRLLGVAVPLTSLLMMITVVTVTFRWLTAADVPWQAARRGGVFTALAGLAGAFLVGFYLSTFGGGGALGAVGGAAILLFFFNLMWMIYVFGVEVTKIYTDYLAFGDVMAPSQRAEPSVFDEPTEPVDRPTPRPGTGGLVAFFLGLAAGRATRRRDS